MLVEHTFVTTRDGPDALAVARDFLLAGGFWVADHSEKHLEVRRGLEKIKQAKGMLQLPQQVRIEYDRGRVNVAVQIQHDAKATAKCKQLLLSIADALEKLLARGAPPEELSYALHLLESEIASEYARRRKRLMIFTIILLVLIFGCLGTLVVALALAN